ncbi:hypothetical protein B7486_29310 [cyanobacterium TDX16]|nr:hypothetical protein B7486_29310 [cyanobacterium TDX16]
MRQLLASARYIMFLPALSNVLAALVLMIYSAKQTLFVILELLSKTLTVGKVPKVTLFKTAISFIEIVDIMLLATVILICGLGLYELFIGGLKLPSWLSIRNLDDLKEKLIKSVIAVIAVQFLVAVVHNDSNLLSYGAAISMVTVALAVFTNLSHSAKKKLQAEDEVYKTEKVIKHVLHRHQDSAEHLQNITSINPQSDRRAS